MEVWFYHLQRRPLESALPALVARTLANGWTAVIQATSPERLAALDDLLWTYDDQSFVAHGTARDGDGALQPVWLTLDIDNPNAASIRFFVEGADAVAALADEGARPKERAIVLFDGRDEDALNRARMQFRQLREQGFALSYWRQNDDGRWEKSA
ncbi:MAG: DNA polymerase III subunit chi [Rhodoblastus sp.]